MRVLTFLILLGSSLSFLIADVIECDNGDRYNGKVLSMDEKTVKLQNEIAGTLTIPRARIVSIAFRPASATTAAAKTAKKSSTTNSPSALKVDPAAVERIQNEYLAGANPEANQLFQEMVRGLASGQLGVGDVRAKAETTLRDLRQMQQE